MNVSERIVFWHSQICPELSIDEFKEQYNLLQVDEWYEGLDNSFKLILKTKDINENIDKWYKLFSPYTDKTREQFVEEHDLFRIDKWSGAMDSKMDYKLLLQIKNYTFRKINEWFQKFSEHDLSLCKQNFMETFGITGGTRWNEELENLLTESYSVIIDKVKDEKFGTFSAMWPELTKDMFNMLYDENLDLESEFQLMFMNVELYHKLMKASYDSGKYYSFNRMIHELDITIQHPCNENLDGRLSSFLDLVN